MKEDLPIIETLKKEGFSKINFDQIFNYLDTLDYEILNTRYIGKIILSNERLAKYFFLRDQLKMQNNSLNETFYINEILDQCIDWSDFWRLLAIKKSFAVYLSLVRHLVENYLPFSLVRIFFQDPLQTLPILYLMRINYLYLLIAQFFMANLILYQFN